MIDDEPTREDWRWAILSMNGALRKDLLDFIGSYLYREIITPEERAHAEFIQDCILKIENVESKGDNDGS